VEKGTRKRIIALNVDDDDVIHLNKRATTAAERLAALREYIVAEAVRHRTLNLSLNTT
jgi:hypothetical protein